MIDAVMETLFGQALLGVMALCFAMSATLMLVGGAVVVWGHSKRLLRWLAR
jgi:hypothetical protein